MRGFDVTASAPKSVSVLWAVGDDHVRAEVAAAHDAAVGAMVGWIERHAHTRYRIDGEVAVVDAEGIVAAAFRQHTSRALDPQLHTHVVIANRVRSDDGRWLALDARTIKVDQRTLSAIYHAGLRAELTARLGVGWRDREHGIAEIAGIPDQVLQAFSARTEDVRRRLEVKLDRFVDSLGREPTPRERWRLEREAVVESRPGKASAADAAVLHDTWRHELTVTGWAPDELVRSAIHDVEVRLSGMIEVESPVVAALSRLAERQSTWRPAEIVRELAAAVEPSAALPAGPLVAWLDQLADQTTAERMVDISRPVPAGVRLRRDGRPVTEAATNRALTTAEILAQEGRVLDWAQRRLDADGHRDPTAADRAVVGLSPGQVDTAAAVAGTAPLVLVVGPAGTGKTTALQPAVAHVHQQRRTVFGVAPSAAAAEVLAEETGLVADTLDKLLWEHTGTRPPAPRYRLPAGTTVIVDEAGMASTPQLAQLAALADHHHWRIVLVDDPRQFSAVGRGGLFTALVDTHGAVELDHVHRFRHAWERDASLRLRAGDTTVLDLYAAQRRIHEGDRRAGDRWAIRGWEIARRHGHTVALLAPTNETVVRLNRLAQKARLAAGELGDHTVTAGPYQLRVGDEIATRRNDRRRHTDRGLMVKNRDTWTIDHLHHGGALTVTGRTGTVRLPAPYVREHVELAYAQTSHAAQGRTVDRSLLILDGPTDVRGVYVPMTRGRESNDVFVVTDPTRTARDILNEALNHDWIDTPATVRRAELAAAVRIRREPERGPIPRLDIRELLEAEHQLRRASKATTSPDPRPAGASTNSNRPTGVSPPSRTPTADASPPPKPSSTATTGPSTGGDTAPRSPKHARPSPG